MKPSARAAGATLFECYFHATANSVAIILFGCGIVFWTPLHAGYTDRDNLILASCSGLTYVIVAANGGRLADLFGPIRMLAASLLGATLALGLGWLIPWKYGPTLVIVLYIGCIGLTWPSIQSLMMKARSSINMPARTGIYNLCWSLANVAGYALAALAVSRLAASPAIFLIPAAIHLLQFLRVVTRRARAESATEGVQAADTDHAGRDLPERQMRRFMRGGWLANAVLNGLIGAFFALAPRLARQLHMSDAATIFLLSTFMVVRSVSFGVLWKWTGWHYRAGWLYAALAAGPASVAAIFFIPHPVVLAAGLSVFGFSAGLAFSASIYYTHNVGRGQARHGGFHEAILGIGGFLGPLIAVGGSLLAERPGGWERAPELALTAAAALAVLAGMGFILLADQRESVSEKGTMPVVAPPVPEA